MTDETPSRPVRRATITINDTNLPGGRLGITDDAGRFAFRDLPAGRYTVSATKPAYLNTAYGARGPARSGAMLAGTAVALSDGQQVTNVNMKMTRGGVISGMIREPGGQPARSARVTVMVCYARSAATGERTLTPGSFGDRSGATDDRGIFRIYGVPPGDYLVSATPGIRRRQRRAASDDE